jgi:hypothetical protein
VADREDHDLPAVEVIEGDVGTVTEFDDPFAEFGEHPVDRSTDLRVGGEGFHSTADGGNGAAGCVGAFGGQEIVETGEIGQSRLTTSIVAFRRSGALARFKFGQPCIGFRSGDVKAGGLVMVPGGESVLAELLPLLFSLNVLFDGLAHDPMRGSAA